MGTGLARLWQGHQDSGIPNAPQSTSLGMVDSMHGRLRHVEGYASGDPNSTHGNDTMTFFTTVLLALALAIPSVAQGPFGLERGMTKSQVLSMVGNRAISKEHHPSSSNCLILNTVPRAHDDYEGYILWFSPTEGLLKIKAIGKNVPTDSYGTSLQRKFAEVVSAVSLKYGRPTDQFDYLQSGALYNAKHEYMEALRHKEQTLSAYWKLPIPLHKVKLIAVDAKADSRESEYISIQFEFTGWEEYVDSSQAEQDSSY
jgi:hypothetical protein